MFKYIFMLKDIAPTWCRAFDKWARLNFHEKEAIKRDLFQENRCIVGEAWGWKDDYLSKCEECAFFGYSFMFLLNGPYKNILDQELLEIKGNEFSEHFCDKHVCLGLTKKTRKKSKERRVRL